MSLRIGLFKKMVSEIYCQVPSPRRPLRPTESKVSYYSYLTLLNSCWWNSKVDKGQTLPNGIFSSSLQCLFYQSQKLFHPFSLKSHHLILTHWPSKVVALAISLPVAGLGRGSLRENLICGSQIYKLVFFFFRKDLVFL